MADSALFDDCRWCHSASCQWKNRKLQDKVGSYGDAREVIINGYYSSNGSGKNLGNSLSGLDTVMKQLWGHGPVPRLCQILCAETVTSLFMPTVYSILISFDPYTWYREKLEISAGKFYFVNYTVIRLFFSGILTAFASIKLINEHFFDWFHMVPYCGNGKHVILVMDKKQFIQGINYSRSVRRLATLMLN